MKVLIFGNLASGKSFLANKILESIPEMRYLSVDEFRKKFGDGTMEKEKIAKQEFIDSIQANELQLIEAMGLGDTGKYIAEKIQQMEEPKLLIILKTPLEVCLSRLKNRSWNVPYPAPSEQALKLAEISHELIVENFIQTLWHCTVNNTIVEIESVDEHNVQQIINSIKRSCANETNRNN